MRFRGNDMKLIKIKWRGTAAYVCNDMVPIHLFFFLPILLSIIIINQSKYSGQTDRDQQGHMVTMMLNMLVAQSWQPNRHRSMCKDKEVGDGTWLHPRRRLSAKMWERSLLIVWTGETASKC